VAVDTVTAAAVAALGREITALQSRIKTLEAGQRTAQLGYSSIDGGTLTVNDGTGTLRQLIGAQPDGTNTTVDLNAAPPAAPDTPVVSAAIGGLVVGWDGQLGGTPPLSDFICVQVHVSAAGAGFTPDATTLMRTMIAPGVVVVPGLTPGTQYWVALVAVNSSGALSAPSPAGSATPINAAQAIPAGSIAQAQLGFTISAGGIAVTFAATAPASPANGDLWFNTAAGNKVSQWNAGTSTWAPYTFGTGAISANAITAALIAANTITAAQIAAASITGDRMVANTITATQIAANTITAAQIQASTITAAQMAAGILYAGIVDGTTIQGATLVAGTAPNVQVRVWTQTGAGQLTVNFNQASVIDGYLQGFYNTTYAQMLLQGPRKNTAGHDDYAGLLLNSSDGTGSANAQLIYNQAPSVGSGQYTMLNADWNGLKLYNVSSISALQPGTGGSAANPPQQEPWHNLVPDVGWSIVSGYSDYKYRVLPNGDIQLTGCRNSAFFSGAFIINSSNPLPAAYRPLQTKDYRCGDAVGRRAHISLAPSGVLTATCPNGVASGTIFAEIDGIIPVNI
jgi:hypothetical protein